MAEATLLFGFFFGKYVVLKGSFALNFLATSELKSFLGT